MLPDTIKFRADHDRAFAEANGDKPAYCSREEFVTAKGTVFASAPLAPAEAMIVAKALDGGRRTLRDDGHSGFLAGKCFANTQVAAEYGISGGLAYVEGFAILGDGFPALQHAWLTINGKVVDPTPQVEHADPILGTFEEREYMGIAFTTAQMSRFWAKYGMGGSVIDALFEGEKDFLFDGEIRFRAPRGRTA